MNANEPVAWINVEKRRLEWDKPMLWETPTVVKLDWIPLYIHPAKTEDEGKVCARCGAIAYDPVITQAAKTLTDEEIKFIAYPFESVYTTYDKQTDTDTVHTRFDQIEFARAILRKAQE